MFYFYSGMINTSPVKIFSLNNLPCKCRNSIWQRGNSTDCVSFSGNKITGDIDFESKFSPKDMMIINLVSNYAKKAGVNVYIVGGCVRDILLNKEVNDLDFLIEGDAVKFSEGLVKELDEYETYYMKSDFGTSKIKLFGEDVDFASTREESYIRKGIPNVKNIGCSMKDDVKRRDFTINSIALQLIADENGKTKFKIRDEINGIQDLNDKKLRVTYQKSFEDDPTRIIRGLKFRLRLGFEYDNETKKLQEEYLKNPPLDEISYSRVEDALKKLFENKETADVAFEKVIDENIYRLYTKETIAKAEWGKKLKESAEIFGIDDYKKLYMTALNDKKTKPLIKMYNKDENLSNYQIYKKLKKLSDIELALYYGITGDKDAIKFQSIKDIKPKVDGNVLISMGYESGKKLGCVLDSLLKEKLNTDNLKTKEDELEFVQKMA